MRSLLWLAVISLLLSGCDEERVFEQNTDFDARHWLISEQPSFKFNVSDTTQPFNIYCNIRNSLDYPYARLFVTFRLTDSTGKVLQKKMVSEMLFDEKTGAPFGESGLGDIYHHRIPLLKNYIFDHAGEHSITMEQFMRKDTLDGILAVGLRVERAAPLNR